jgi:flagellar protein FliO/FliZ
MQSPVPIVTQRCLLMISLLAPGAARAADTPEVAGSIGQMLLGLAVVVGLLLATLWILKRVAAPRGAASALKVLGAAPVGPRERVVLVEVAGKVLVLGVAPGRVNALHTLEATDLPALATASEPPAGEFHKRLRQFLEAKG